MSRPSDIKSYLAFGPQGLLTDKYGETYVGTVDDAIRDCRRNYPDATTVVIYSYHTGRCLRRAGRTALAEAALQAAEEEK